MLSSQFALPTERMLLLEKWPNYKVRKKNKVPVGTLNRTLNGTLSGILNYLQKNPAATQKQLSVALGESIKKIKNGTDELQQKGLLEREGAKKNGRWIVKNM